ncbi:VirE protein [Prevotella communis]
MNYSCLPNEDGSLKGSKTMSTTVGMDIDHLTKEEMPTVRERILQKKEELGLLMLEESARGGGYHLVFRRRPELSQEENLKWASELLEVKYDDGAKDITRVFFTTTGSAEDLLFLDDEIFRLTPSRLTPSPSLLREGSGQTQGQKLSTPLPHREGMGESLLSTPLSHREGMGESLEGKGESLSFPSDFKGISYTSIIGEFWRRTGGEPSEGERNKRLHQLAANLRAICDDNEEWLLEVMPRYGLPAQEMRSIIHSACKEPTKGSRLIDKIVKALETGISPDEVDDAEAVQEETGVKVNVKALPSGLKESLTGVPVSMHMPVLCSLMPLAAAYADQVEVRYCDGEMQKLGMMSIIYGEQASGKSVCKHAVNIWKRQLDDEDALARKREDEWKERKKNRKANEKAPDDPKVLIRVVPVTVSCSTLLKRLKNADGHTLFSFGEELDTLRKTNGAGSWSSKYDIYRLAFDPIDSEWGQDYNSDQAESGVVKVAYNWSMLGTSGAVRKCFKADNVENGLSSRILLAEMPDTSFAKMPHYGRRTQEDESKIQEAVTRLRSYSGYVDTPRLRKAIDQWVEEQRVMALKDVDHVKDTYRRRAAVIGFRCGVIFHLLTGRVKESNACVEFATMMASYCLNQQIKVFGAALQNQYVDAQQECQRYGANNSIFDQLPPTFTADDLAALKPANVPRNSIIKIISRWNRDGWVVKADSKRWSKTKSDNDKVTS